MDFKYNDGGRDAAGLKGKVGDCVARAIAIAAELPYKEVYEALANGNAGERITKSNRKSGGIKTAAHGIKTTRKWFKDYMATLGWVWTPTMGIGTGCRVHLKASELPAGRLIVSVSKHMVAVVDGVIQDTHDCSRNETRCVYGYWQKAEAV